jgi:pseudouridine-5'-phosphate glycosidase
MEVNSFFARPSPFDDPDALERVEQVTPIEKWKWLVEVEYRGAVTIVTRKAPEETLA